MGQCSGMTPENRGYHSSMRGRWGVFAIGGLRLLCVVLTVALLAIFAVAGSIAEWLPHTTWFVALFVAAGVGLIFLFDRIAKHYDL